MVLEVSLHSFHQVHVFLDKNNHQQQRQQQLEHRCTFNEGEFVAVFS